MEGRVTAPAPTFYCVHGDHWTHNTDIERLQGDRGICLECSLNVYDLLREVMFVAGPTPAELVKQRRAWEKERAGRRLDRKMRAGVDEPGWVYYVSQGDVVKIGFAKDVPSRVKAYGPTARVLAVHPGTKAVERAMHVRFREDLAYGREWFTPSEALETHIASVVEQFGDPSRFDYEYSRPKTQEEAVRDMFATRRELLDVQGAWVPFK